MDRPERCILKEFIELYCNLPCLWDTGLEVYKDKDKKTEAWNLLTEKLKLIEPGANVAYTKKKIDNLRSAYQREAKKINKLKLSGANEDYSPRLWYFDIIKTIFVKKEQHCRCEADPASSDEQSLSDTEHSGMSSVPIKRERYSHYKEQKKLLKSDIKRRQEDKRPNTFGVYVTEQLEAVDSFQRHVAEKLISDVLFLAKTGNLSYESKIDKQVRPGHSKARDPLLRLEEKPTATNRPVTAIYMPASPTYIPTSPQYPSTQMQTTPTPIKPSPVNLGWDSDSD